MWVLDGGAEVLTSVWIFAWPLSQSLVVRDSNCIYRSLCAWVEAQMQEGARLYGAGWMMRTTSILDGPDRWVKRRLNFGNNLKL